MSDIFRARSTGDDWMNSFQVATGEESSAIHYFLKQGVGLTTTRADGRVATYLSVSNTKNGQINLRLYGEFGNNDPTAAPTANYTLVLIPPQSTLEITNLKIYGMGQVTDPGAGTSTYYIAR